MTKKIRWAVFASGNGTNLQNFLNLEKQGMLPTQEIALVHVDRPCRAQDRAQLFNKAIVFKSSKDPDYTPALLERLNLEQIDRIFLLGYMRILKPDFLKAFSKPIINLHPSLLPKHRGLDAIRKAYEAGDEELGVSIHEVVEELDAGPILHQAKLVRNPNESLEELTERLHQLEYQSVRDYLLSLESGVRLE